MNRVLIARRKHTTEALLRATQPPRRSAHVVRRHVRPATYYRHLEAAKVHSAFLLEATTRTARSTAHLLVPNTTTANRCPAATLRRLRHPVAERARQHGRRHGHGHGWRRREQPLCLQRLRQERVRHLRSGISKTALFRMRNEPKELGAVLVTINLIWLVDSTDGVWLRYMALRT
jgi:hypothetical protein